MQELAGSSHLLAGAAWRIAASPDLAAVAAATRIACYAGPHQQQQRRKPGDCRIAFVCADDDDKSVKGCASFACKTT